MESQGFPARLHVVVAVAARVVGGVYADTEIGTEHEHADVKTQSRACAGGQVLEECAAA